MKTTVTAVKLFLLLSIVTGLLYPLAVWGYAELFFRQQAEGGIISRNGRQIGAELIGQKFEKPEYFRSRPSAVDCNPMPSGGSNLSPTSKQLRDNVNAQRTKFGADAPADLLFASASGLDPHISPQAALSQTARVAKTRNAQEVDIISLVEGLTEPRQFGFLGESRVNVLKLNLALDEKYGR